MLPLPSFHRKPASVAYRYHCGQSGVDRDGRLIHADVAATNATSVTVTGTDGSSYTLTASGGTQAVSPTATTTYTATADGAAAPPRPPAPLRSRLCRPGSVQSIDHVIFMLQENHTFDDYFGMLNPYRANNKVRCRRRRRHLHSGRYRRQGQWKELQAVRGSTVLSNKDKQGTVHTLYPLRAHVWMTCPPRGRRASAM